MQPSAFLDSAEAIFTQATEEVDYRNACSRAYYAFYHVCKEIAESSCSIGPGTAHDKVIRSLKEHNDKSIRKLGNSLFQARNFRTQADYHLDLTFCRGTAEQTIKLVKRRMEEINSINKAS